MAETLPLTERVLRTLRDEILRGHLRPGQTVLEQELAARYGVSKTPVRDALRLLAQDGWVVVIPRRGYLIRPLGIEDLREVFALREVLEPELAAAAARNLGRGAGDPELASSVATQRDAGDDLDLGLASAGAFHLRIAELSGHPRGARFVSTLVDEVNRLHYLMPNLRDHISSADEVAEHEAILAAIESGDAESAHRLMREHLVSAQGLLVAAFGVVPRATRAVASD